MSWIRNGYKPGFFSHGNTLLAVVATNAPLTKTQCTRVAQMAQDALARCIYPVHMPWDGDTVFAISTGTWTREKAPDVGIIGALAADALATAIIRGVLRCESWRNYPAAKDYLKSKKTEARNTRKA
jgi:L-aminopeptidase/D-esterase-like protein